MRHQARGTKKLPITNRLTKKNPKKTTLLPSRFYIENVAKEAGVNIVNPRTEIEKQ